MSQLAALSRLNALHPADATPSAVTTARVVSIVQAGILLTVGIIALLGGVTVLGAASLVEGALRLGLAVGLRRGARRTRLALLVLCGVGVFAGFAAGGVSIIGGVINVVVMRCLLTDDAKRFLGA
ncbi:MAG TPA: hypothetical protein PK020_19870 [Ilumatobacteraceae bacterium]|nr:hypothetical protein [Ilumatobacteraceae bacterium]